MLELYQAYADYGDMMALVQELVAHLATELHGTTALTYDGRELDLSTPWRRASMVELIEEAIGVRLGVDQPIDERSEEHTSELHSLMRISYAVFCLKNKLRRHSR